MRANTAVDRVLVWPSVLALAPPLAIVLFRVFPSELGAFTTFIFAGMALYLCILVAATAWLGLTLMRRGLHRRAISALVLPIAFAGSLLAWPLLMRAGDRLHFVAMHSHYDR